MLDRFPSWVLPLLALLGSPLISLAETSSETSAPLSLDSPCASPERRQFDFWIGDWRVELPDGSLAGTNRITPTLDGCGLEEHWMGARGMTGRSFNYFDPSDQQWHQTWIDSRGGALLLAGRFDAGEMRLSGATRTATGAEVINRITWTPQGPDLVRQVWETSTDRGTTWSVVFDGRYNRVRS
ncbi:MAG: hypothetical protein IPK72_20765 [Candidatus Eisenbacteria bacterium]|nr:hypothetical protein [Candidatus Eisenbacteria bacterium]